MRRMNSMLLGHHGASARTDCMYLSIASCVASSFQDSGRCTMRDGTSMSSSRRQLVLDRLTARRSDRSRGSTRGVVVDLQRADAGREIDDAGQS